MTKAEVKESIKNQIKALEDAMNRVDNELDSATVIVSQAQWRLNDLVEQMMCMED